MGRSHEWLWSQEDEKGRKAVSRREFRGRRNS